MAFRTWVMLGLLVDVKWPMPLGYCGFGLNLSSCYCFVAVPPLPLCRKATVAAVPTHHDVGFALTAAGYARGVLSAIDSSVPGREGLGGALRFFYDDRNGLGYLC